MRTAWLFSMSLIIGAIPTSADQAPVNSRSTKQFGALRPAPSSNPYSKLFEAREALKQAVDRESAVAAPKTRIVCGMTIIEAPPFFDARMGVWPPKDDKVRYTIHAVDPAVCDSSAPR